MSDRFAEPRPEILLLDGHSLAYRAFYALPDTIRTQTGELTNAVYGFTSMLIRLLSERQPDAVAVAFDRGRDVARTAAFPEYKANRAAPPDGFRPQVPLIQQVLEVLGIPVVEVEGVEADDVLATLATRAVDAGYHAAVVTGDRDAMQLPAEHLTVLYTLRGLSDLAEMTPAAVEERFGVPPGRYVEVAALRGDTSDNLPGVPGVGDKTAAKLVARFGDVDGVYRHLDEISGKKVPAMLAEHEQQVRTNLAVMRLRRDVEVALDPDRLGRGDVDLDAVRELFGTLEFRALYDRLLAEVLGEQTAADAAAFEHAPRRLQPGQLAAWLRELGDPDAQQAGSVDAPPAVLVTLTGRVPHPRVDAVALAAVDRDPVTAELDQLDDDDRAVLAAWLADPDRPKVTHDLKSLDHAAAVAGWSLAGVVLDTELAAYLLEPERRSFELDRLAGQYLHRTLAAAAPSTEADQLALAVDTADDAWPQRAVSALAAAELAGVLAEQLEQRDQRELAQRIELPLAPVLARMERTGIAVDRAVLDAIRSRLSTRVSELELEVHDHAGRRFNVGSGPQLQQVLFEELGLPRTRRIKTGYSTDAQAMQQLRGRHAIVDAILEWREVSKLLSTYVDALPPLIDRDSGRIHTTLSQTIAATGRLSSAHPNLQNIPVRRAEGREIRRAFVPGDGYDLLLVADYSQIELRIMAHLSGDEALLGAFASGEDVHATTAARVFDLPLDEVDGALRDRAKAINYGLAYGLTAFGLAQQLDVPPDEAQAIVDAYLERFPGVRSYLDDAVESARRDGYTTTLFGRRRYLPDLRADDRNRRQMAERMALNAPIQGTAADVIKLAMIRLQAALDASGLAAQLLLQVHDEVILEVTDADREEVRALVVEQLSGVAHLDVDLEVDTAAGRTWFDTQKH